MTDQKRAYLLASAAILMWSTIASAFKLTLQYLNYFQIIFISSAVSCIVLFIIILFQKKLPLFKIIKLRDLARSAILGLINPFLYYFVLLKAYSLLKAQEAVTLNYIWPITLVLLSIPLLKQRINWMSLIAIFISFFGIIVIATEGNIQSLEFKEPLGVILAIGSSIFWAFYWIYNLKDKRDEVIKLCWNFIFGTIYIAVAVILFSEFEFRSAKGIIGGIYIGIFEMGITFFLWLSALHYSENAAKVSNLVYLSPFISLLVINLIIGEKILLSTLAGLIIIVTGIVLQKVVEVYAGKVRR